MRSSTDGMYQQNKRVKKLMIIALMRAKAASRKGDDKKWGKMRRPLTCKTNGFELVEVSCRSSCCSWAGCPIIFWTPSQLFIFCLQHRQFHHSPVLRSLMISTHRESGHNNKETAFDFSVENQAKIKEILSRYPSNYKAVPISSFFYFLYFLYFYLLIVCHHSASRPGAAPK